MQNTKHEKKTGIRVNYMLNAAYQLLSVCIPIITTPYISRVLMAEGIGAYSYTLSIATYFAMFGALGLATQGQIEIAKVQNDIYMRSKVFYEVFITKIITMLLAILLYFSLYTFQNQYKELYIILSINLFSTLFDITWFFQGLENFKIIVTRNIVIKLVCTILIFQFISKPQDISLYAFILQLSCLLGNLSLFISINKYIVKVNLSDLEYFKHIKQSVVYFIPTIATSVYTILDKSMIGWFTNSAFENGVYEQAHKIEQMLLMVITSLGTVTLPRITYLFHDKNIDKVKNIIDNSVRFILFISIPMSVGLMCISKTLIPLFLGPNFEKCIILLNIFSVLLVLIGLDNTIGKQCLVAQDKQKKFNIGVIAGAIANIICNIILIPRLKSIGAAIGSVVAEATILVVFIIYSVQIINIKKLLSMFIHYLSCSIIMALVVISLEKYINKTWSGLIIQIVIGIITYLAVTIFTDKFYENCIRRKTY